MKKILSILLAAFFCMSFSSCVKNGESDIEENEIKKEQGVICLQMRDPDILDPIKTSKQSVRDGLLTLYEPLFNITSDFNLEPVLAETYAFNDSATVMTLKIKEGVLWHNNHVFTADDVIYTIGIIKSTPSSSYYLNVEKIDRVEKLNDYELVFYLKEPYALFVYNLYFPIMHVNTSWDEFVGTGAYRFGETDGKQLVLKKNTAWHNGEVKNDGVKFIFMKTTLMAQEAFSSGKIHAVPREMIDTQNFAIKESNKKYNYPNGLFEFAGFNTTSGIFADKRLRSAASNALDRDKLAEIFDGGESSVFPVMKGSAAFSPTYESVNYGADYAMEVIFSAGWSDLDGDGKSEKIIDGEMQTLSVNLLASNQDRERTVAAEKVKEQLEEAGFDVKLDVVDITDYNTRISGGEFDMFLGAVYCNQPYDMTQLLSTGGKVNYTGFSNSSMDEAIALFKSSPDIDTSTVAFSKIQSLYNEYQPITGIIFRNSYVLTSSAIEGEVNPYPYSPYGNINNWILK